MIKGKRGIYSPSRSYPFQADDWVMVHINGTEQKVGQVVWGSVVGCGVRFYKNETWTEVESGLERVEITSATHHVPITSIACKLPEEVAKNLLLLQGVEL